MSYKTDRSNMTRAEVERERMADKTKRDFIVCGFDGPALREIIRIRKQDKAERQEHEAILELYLHALGMMA